MPRGSGPLTRALVATLLLATGLTACVPFGTDQGPTRRPSSSPTVSASGAASASGSASPTPVASATPTALPAWGPLPDGVAPARPAALDQPPTLDGAKAVAVYFLLLYPYAYQTGDLAAWNALSHPACAFCSDTAVHVRQQAAGGQHSTGGNVSVAKLDGTEVDVGHFFEIQAIIHETTSHTVDSFGSVVEDIAQGATFVDMVVLFEDGSWTVRGVDHEAVTA